MRRRTRPSAGVAWCSTSSPGARGKSGSNDANAEYIAHLRAIMDQAGVFYQFAELGKVDQGGGGTIAYILAKYGMNAIDSRACRCCRCMPPGKSLQGRPLRGLQGYAAFLQNA